MNNGLGTTFPIITKRVGEGGVTYGDDVKRINQLLRMAKLLDGQAADDNKWRDKSVKALLELQKNLGQFGKPVEFIEPKPNLYRYDLLALLALKAGVLIRLPNGLRSASAMLNFYENCRAKNYPYSWEKGNKDIVRVIWGFENRPEWAISTNLKKFFEETKPIALNCTSFANLVMSVWITGNAHSKMYDASQATKGVDDLLSMRYGMMPLNDNKFIFDGYCFDLETLQKLEQNRIYSFASCYGDTGGVKHDMILYNGEVYECNLYHTPSVFKTKLDTKFKEIMSVTTEGGRAVRVAGPSPV